MQSGLRINRVVRAGRCHTGVRVVQRMGSERLSVAQVTQVLSGFRRAARARLPLIIGLMFHFVDAGNCDPGPVPFA